MKRRTIIGGLTAAIVAAAGGAAWKLRLFGHHYPPTPYDDLLNQIVDREPAARLGAVINQARPQMTAQSLAGILRRAGLRLSVQALRDADQNRLMEADGWVVPQSVGFFAALAAKV